MVNLNERGDAIDLVTLKDELGRSGDLDAVGGPAYIASLVDGCATVYERRILRTDRQGKSDSP